MGREKIGVILTFRVMRDNGSRAQELDKIVVGVGRRNFADECLTTYQGGGVGGSLGYYADAPQKLVIRIMKMF